VPAIEVGRSRPPRQSFGPDLSPHPPQPPHEVGAIIIHDALLVPVYQALPRGRQICLIRQRHVFFPKNHLAYLGWSIRLWL